MGGACTPKGWQDQLPGASPVLRPLSACCASRLTRRNDFCHRRTASQPGTARRSSSDSNGRPLIPLAVLRLLRPPCAAEGRLLTHAADSQDLRPPPCMRSAINLPSARWKEDIACTKSASHKPSCTAKADATDAQCSKRLVPARPMSKEAWSTTPCISTPRPTPTPTPTTARRSFLLAQLETQGFHPRRLSRIAQQPLQPIQFSVEIVVALLTPVRGRDRIVNLGQNVVRLS